MDTHASKRPLYAALWLSCACWLLPACNPPDTSGEAATEQQRIVSLSGAITETLHALGYGSHIVGVDVTSTYPEAAKALPNLGHVSRLNPEGVLALHPDLIFAEAKDSSAPGMQQLVGTGVPIHWVPKPETLDGALASAKYMSAVLAGGQAALEALRGQIDETKAALGALLAQKASKPKVLFIYARGKGSLLAAGTGTAAEAMIRAAGGQNAVTAFEGFKALSPEGLIQAQPDVILMFDSGLDSVDGLASLLLLPGVAETPAGKNQRVIAMDGHYLLGFGPRAAQAALELARQL